MQNLLVDTRLCYLPSAEHQHIREGLRFEELHHHSPLDVEVAGEERPVCLLSVVSYHCNCSIIMLLLLTATTCLSTCGGCRGRWGNTVRETTLLRGWEVVDYREAWKIPSSLLNTALCPVWSVCSASEMQIIREISEETKVYFRLMTKLHYSLSI